MNASFTQENHRLSNTKRRHAQLVYRIDPDIVIWFAGACRLLGIPVRGRQKPIDYTTAQREFTELIRLAPDQCDVWVGLAASSNISQEILEKIYTTSENYGYLQNLAEVETKYLKFCYNTGLYFDFTAQTPNEFALAYAASLISQAKFLHAYEIITPIRQQFPQWFDVQWLAIMLYYRSERWDEVTNIIKPLLANEFDSLRDCALRTIMGISLAKLGLFIPALDFLDLEKDPSSSIATDANFARALILRAIGDENSAQKILQALYAENPQQVHIKAAIDDPKFQLITTSVDKIKARIDPWNPNSEPDDGNFLSENAKAKKAELLAEAEKELANFIGMPEVKEQVERLKSSVGMALLRQARGLTVIQRAQHLIFAGPPGTGKTAIARIVAKIYCGLGILKKETVVEVIRPDLVGQHVGETEVKTSAIIDKALDGVLFIDEAYTLVSGGSKSDFGQLAIDTLLARMENDRDRLVVIIAGYPNDLDQFLNANEGLRSRFARTIEFKSYTTNELVEMAIRVAQVRDTVFSEDAKTALAKLFAYLSSQTIPDASGIPRPSMDIAGNGRFVRNVIERSEENREYRLFSSEDPHSLSDEDFRTITAEDVNKAACALMQSIGVELPK